MTVEAACRGPLGQARLLWLLWLLRLLLASGPGLQDISEGTT